MQCLSGFPVVLRVMNSHLQTALPLAHGKVWMSRLHPQKGNDRSLIGACASGCPALPTHQATVESIFLNANQRACPIDCLMIVYDPDWASLSLSL